MKKITVLAVTALALFFSSVAYADTPLTGDPKFDHGKKQEQQLKEGKVPSGGPVNAGGLTDKVSAKIKEAKKANDAKKAEAKKNENKSTTGSSTSTNKK